MGAYLRKSDEDGSLDFLSPIVLLYGNFLGTYFHEKGHQLAYGRLGIGGEVSFQTLFGRVYERDALKPLNILKLTVSRGGSFETEESEKINALIESYNFGNKGDGFKLAWLSASGPTMSLFYSALAVFLGAFSRNPRIRNNLLYLGLVESIETIFYSSLTSREMEITTNGKFNYTDFVETGRILNVPPVLVSLLFGTCSLGIAAYAYSKLNSTER